MGCAPERTRLARPWTKPPRGAGLTAGAAQFTAQALRALRSETIAQGSHPEAAAFATKLLLALYGKDGDACGLQR